MADQISSREDDPGNLSTQTSALLDRPIGGGGGGMGNYAPPKITPRDYSAGFRSLGYGSNESAGQTQVKTPQGPSQQGRDVPGTGVPAPADGIGDAGAGEAAAGGAEAAGAASGVAELAPLALAL